MEVYDCMYTEGPVSRVVHLASALLISRSGTELES